MEETNNNNNTVNDVNGVNDNNNIRPNKERKFTRRQTQKRNSTIKRSRFNKHSTVKSIPNLGRSSSKKYSRIVNELRKISQDEQDELKEMEAKLKEKKQQERLLKNDLLYLSSESNKDESSESLNVSEIIEALNKEPSSRTFNDINVIKSYLHTTHLAKNLNEIGLDKDSIETMLVLCAVEIKHKITSHDEIIYKIGDTPNDMYIIYSGSVALYKPKAKKTEMTGYEYYTHLISLKKDNNMYLYNKTINTNQKVFHIKYKDVDMLQFIFIRVVLDKLIKGKAVSFISMLEASALQWGDIGLPTPTTTTHVNGDDPYYNKYVLSYQNQLLSSLPIMDDNDIKLYNFLYDDFDSRIVITFIYDKLNTLPERYYFGDITMNIKQSMRNETAICHETCQLLCIDCNHFYTQLCKEKQLYTQREVNFLQQNFFFTKISTKHFERKFFNLFEYQTYYKDDTIFTENTEANYVYFIRYGEVSLFSNRTIVDIHKLLLHLNETLKLKKDIPDYSKLKTSISDLSNDVFVKEKNKIISISSNESLGVESAFYGLNYLTTAIITSDKARLVRITFEQIKSILTEESSSLFYVKLTAEKRVQLFYDRFLQIINTRLNLVDSKLFRQQNDDISRFNKEQEEQTQMKHHKNHYLPIVNLKYNVNLMKFMNGVSCSNKAKIKFPKIKKDNKSISKDISLSTAKNTARYENSRNATMQKTSRKYKASNCSISAYTGITGTNTGCVGIMKSLSTSVPEKMLLKKLQKETQTFMKMNFFSNGNDDDYDDNNNNIDNSNTTTLRNDKTNNNNNEQLLITQVNAYPKQKLNYIYSNPFNSIMIHDNNTYTLSPKNNNNKYRNPYIAPITQEKLNKVKVFNSSLSKPQLHAFSSTISPEKQNEQQQHTHTHHPAFAIQGSSGQYETKNKITYNMIKHKASLYRKLKRGIANLLQKRNDKYE